MLATKKLKSLSGFRITVRGFRNRTIGTISHHQLRFLAKRTDPGTAWAINEYLRLWSILKKANPSTAQNQLRIRGNLRDIYAQRGKALCELGFSDYKQYLESSLWDEIRARVMKRDSSLCRACNSTAMQAHHQEYTRDTLSGADISKIVAVCGKCHRGITRCYGNAKLVRLAVAASKLSQTALKTTLQNLGCASFTEYHRSSCGKDVVGKVYARHCHCLGCGDKPARVLFTDHAIETLAGLSLKAAHPLCRSCWRVVQCEIHNRKDKTMSPIELAAVATNVPDMSPYYASQLVQGECLSDQDGAEVSANGTCEVRGFLLFTPVVEGTVTVFVRGQLIKDAKITLIDKREVVILFPEPPKPGTSFFLSYEYDADARQDLKAPITPAV